MSDVTQSRTESLIDIIKGIREENILLPEFQRDFRWELEQTYDLFDSLIRNIFVGTIIYGKPSFEMTLREIDTRPRSGKGSRTKLNTISLNNTQIINRTQAHNLKIVLDGQQRITSIYRAIVGIDTVYITLKEDIDVNTVAHKSLEDIFELVSGEESRTAVSIKLKDAYETEINSLDDEDLDERFAKSQYANSQIWSKESKEYRDCAKLYRRSVRKVIDFFKSEKMLSYYLLDMSLDKFCIFFERSNSRGIQLNFTDILAAKLYHGFNLRKKIEEFQSTQPYLLNREIIVRAIAYITGEKKGGRIKIDKSYILEQLTAEDFNNYWDYTVKLYTETLEYLIEQKYIVSQSWIPSENMLIPIMMFRSQIKEFSQMTDNQRKFIEFWYWSSIFANRYSSASNEIIILDSVALVNVAKNEKIANRNFFTKIRSLIQEPDDLLSYTKKSSATYKGILNLIAYEAQGLMDWSSKQKIQKSMKLEDHHIYPRAYIASEPSLDMDQDEASQLVDCVVNRTLIPKITNITIGKKPPQQYLSELKNKNSTLDQCLESHLISPEIISDELWNECFKSFLEERSKKIFNLIKKFVIDPYSQMIELYKLETDIDVR